MNQRPRLARPHRAVPASLLGLVLLAACSGGSIQEQDQPWPVPVQQVPRQAPVLSPEEALETFHLPPGYEIELVAAEPLIHDPVAIDFDPDGRMYVVEMRGYMPNLEGEGEDQPVGRIVVLEDGDDDGRMDRKTVYMDSLVMPRSVKVLERGVLVAAPPYLWLTRDTDGDLRADTREVVRDDYGNPRGNPEHNDNGLFWGMDNWLHNAKSDAQLRLRDGRFVQREVPAAGQWGVSMDDYGRLYRNSNSDPLRADLVPSHYFARNPNLASTRGAYERLTTNGPVWPVRPTPAVNRGYQERTLRDDSTLAEFTAAASPTAYVGDRLPRELRNDVFVSEVAGNLVRRFRVQEGPDGRPTAENAYTQAEFLASTDERFRPVFLSSAPDGTLYVVDMYRGIIQHRVFITDYLEHQIRNRNLEQPIGLGRIYRIVHRSTRRGESPRLSRRSPAELVRTLEHPNGWWRVTAQRLLVERGDASAVPALERMARSSRDDRARLHALWTLEGLQRLDPALVQQALGDESPHVRAAAIRLAEPWLSRPGHPLRAAVRSLLDSDSPLVRRQLAASLGELPPAEREDALAEVLARHGADPIVLDLVVSGLHGRELPFLERLLGAGATPGEAQRQAVELLAATVLRSGDGAAIQRLFARVGDERQPQWQRLALLAGLTSAAPRGGAGRNVRALELPAPPEGLLAAAAGPEGPVRQAAQELASVLTWPGKPEDPDAAREQPLTPEERELLALGQERYMATCAGCHQPSGEGMAGVAKSLVGSDWVVGGPGQLIRIVLHGKEGEMLMPPIGASLPDREVAAILTYIRRSWGNEASAVSPAQVREVRGYSTGRSSPWTDEELRSVRR